MDNPIQVDLGRIAQDLQIRRVQVESVVQLLDEGNTVPFITRYRKERTGNLNEVVIHEIQLRVQRLRELAERKETILKAIEAQGKLHPDLAAAIRAAENPKRLEDLYLPFKPKKRTKASDARDKGLEPLALRVWNRDETLTDLGAAAAEFVNAEKGLETPEKVMEGVGHILSEAISEMAAVRDAVRKVVWKTGKIVTSKGDVPEGQGLEYRDYFDYSEPLSHVPPHRVLAINRGDKEGPLKIKFEVARPELEAAFFHQIPLESHPQAEVFRAAAMDALDRLILPSMEREVRRDLTEAAEKHAVEVFARNLRSLLLQPPISKQVVLAVDPGLRSGCKVAVLDPHGNLLDQAVIYPHAPQNRRSEAKVFLKDLVGKHGVGVVAIGNGTACRETEELIAEIIAEGVQFSQGGGPPPSQGATPPNGGPGQSEPTMAEPGHFEPAMAEAGHPEPAATATPERAVPVTLEEVAAAATGEEPPGSGQESHAPEEPAAQDRKDDNGSVEPTESEPAELEASASLHEIHQAQPGPASLPEETLPPISGGAPDSFSTEAETTPGTEPGPDSQLPPATNHEPTDEVTEGTPAPVIDGHNPVEEPAASAVEAESTGHGPDAPGEFTGSGTLEAHEESTSEPTAEGQAAVDAAPAAESGPPASAESVSPASEEAPAPTPQAEPQAAPTPIEDAVAEISGAETPPQSAAPRGEGKPGSEGRRGGSGKHEGGRSRGPRPRPATTPPPPPSPPEPHQADHLLAQLAYVIVNEAGASVYSTSQVGRDELPEFDATLRSAISIGRRLQDPLAELVKIEPQNIGVGLYQHDVNPKQLKETLESVICSCVNFVGVDLNTASVSLLRHVSGLNQLTARRIVDFRKEKGSFSARELLTQVEGIGPATFTQAAGFLKIPEAAHPFDRTWVHPESYAAATRLLEKVSYTPEVVLDKARLPELQAKLAEANVPELAKELEAGEFTLRDIIEALSRPERDPRDDLPKPIFKKGILKLEDLAPAMELKGTVLNVVDFGAFVDIGLKDSGLVHISQLANRYIKSPHDVVTVWVMSVDQERKRVSLTMVKPGTERQRGGPQGGPRRGPAGNEPPREGQGQGRRDRGRGPRPSGSALTSPPVGAPPVTTLTETPGRRPDRDRERGGVPPTGGQPGQPGQAEGGSRPLPPGGFPHVPSGPRQGPGPPRGGPRGGQGPFRHGSGPGSGPGRPGPFRPERSQGPRGPARPSRPGPPPPPLSKEALTGSVPLRTFGQLKQLWEARVDSPEDAEPGQPVEPRPEPPTNDQSAPSPDPAISAPPPAEAAPGDTGSP
jgi:uncharacterized protein